LWKTSCHAGKVAANTRLKKAANAAKANACLIRHLTDRFAALCSVSGIGMNESERPIGSLLCFVKPKNQEILTGKPNAVGKSSEDH
jgi:hypothetical protein